MKQLLKQIGITIVMVAHTFSLGMLWFMNRQPIATVAAQPITVQSQDLTEAIVGVPARLVIPSLALDLHVLPGEYSRLTDSWTLTGYNAHFATMTPPANNLQGNTFIYGHNNKHVFGPLKQLKPSAEVIVIADNGNQFTYRFESVRTVIPEDVTLFNYQGSPILTIQTCTGAWHEKRQLYQFAFVRVVESQAQLQQKVVDRHQMLLQTLSQPLMLMKTPSELPL